MGWCFESDTEGNIKEWYVGEGQCPNCGAPCVASYPETSNTLFRIYCDYCKYKEGFSSGSD